MTKVWLLSQGEYSGWTILGIFSTEERAKQAKAEWDRDAGKYLQSNDIEVHKLDGLKVVTSYYEVEFSEDGVIRDVTRIPKEEKDTSWIPETRFSDVYAGGARLQVFVATESKEAAIKIAAEKWTEIRALGNWGDNSIFTQRKLG